ncbi:MAG: glycoside hydrolase family 78 protein, partial [Bacillales bacterium]|nr:glycoside hydrolase family 78 protein [Bacillales bacterium]
GGEVYDARLESAWATSECTPDWDNGWMFPIYAPAEKGKLIPQKIPPIKICQEYQAIQVFDNVYDFAHNISGWVQISVRGNKGDRVIIKYAERLDNNKINQLNLRSAESKDEYILKGEGLEIWHPRFTYHGFQYVEVTLIGEVILQSIIAQHLHTDNKLIGYFETDDEIINKLHEISVITEQNNEHSILTDCPQRDERFGWLNDVSTRVFQAVNNFDMDLLFYKVVRDIKDAQNAEGMISDTCPYYTGGQPADVTSLSFLLLANEAYIHYGDKKIVEDFYLYHKKWVDYLLTRQKDYIMDYYYYADWVPADKLPNALSDGIYISTAFLFWHLKTLAKLAKYINKRNDNKRYLEIAEKVRVALNKKYYNVETGLYSRGTHAELSFALNLDIVEAKERAKVLDNLIKSINEVGNHLTCGNQGYRHVFEVLCKEGYTDLFLDILKNPEYPGWGFMLKCGATTVWERWEEEMSNLMDSFDHPMFGAYDQMFYKYLAGINFEGFGCDNIIIRPISCRLNYIKASIHTIHGLLSSESKRVGKYINYTITVPSNKIVTFIPPFKIKEINGIKRNVKEVRLESGVYTIKIKEK